jgi:hypothetical protein
MNPWDFEHADPFVLPSPICEQAEALEERLLHPASSPISLDFSEAFHFFESVIFAHPENYGTCVWNTVGQLCHAPRTQDQTLGWLKGFAPSISQPQRGGLTIAMLEILPEPPVSWRVLRHCVAGDFPRRSRGLRWNVQPTTAR